MILKQYFGGRARSPDRQSQYAPRHAAAEPLESRRLLASVAGDDLFGPAQTVHVSGADAHAAFSPQNLLDGTAAAFRFDGGATPQRVGISHFNAAVHTLRFFDAPPAQTSNSMTISSEHYGKLDLILDETKVEQDVRAIAERDDFQQLRDRARELRRHRVK